VDNARRTSQVKKEFMNINIKENFFKQNANEFTESKLQRNLINYNIKNYETWKDMRGEWHSIVYKSFGRIGHLMMAGWGRKYVYCEAESEGEE
jgi:hypothetical protein